MQITDNGDEVLIEFNSLSSKLKVLFFCGALISLPFITTGFVWSYTAAATGKYGLLVLTFGMIFLGLAIIRRYIIRVFSKERISITKDKLTIINTTFRNKQVRSYNIEEIAFLNYMGRGRKTDHPLKGKSYDYLGFETQELVIAEVNTEGNISFSYGGKIIHFGKDVYSWHAEKINEVFKKVTNGAISIGNLPDEIQYE